jgi:transcriptional regulator with XRE-family HTH domain
VAGEEEEYREKVREMGAEIRARRESLGLSIEEVQNKTKIRSKYLLAVESGDEERAPGATYFKAFLKTYSTFLGLDGARYSQAYQETVDLRAAPLRRERQKASKPLAEAQKPAAERQKPVVEAKKQGGGEQKPAAAEMAGREELIRQPLPLPQETEEAQEPQPQPVPEPRPHRPARRPRRTPPVLWAFVLFFAVALIVFFAVSKEKAAEVASRGASPAAPAAPGIPASPGTATPEAPKPPEAPKFTRSDPDPETTVFTVDRTPLDLTIKASAGSDSYCWIGVSVDGSPSMGKTLMPGQEQKVSANSGIEIRAGKPWVISLVLNGKDLGVAGEYGPVKDIFVRVVPKTP